MRKYILTIIILSFYAVGLLHATYKLPIVVPIAIGLCAAIFSNHIDDKMK